MAESLPCTAKKCLYHTKGIKKVVGMLLPPRGAPIQRSLASRPPSHSRLDEIGCSRHISRLAAVTSKIKVDPSAAAVCQEQELPAHGAWPPPAVAGRQRMRCEGSLPCQMHLQAPLPPVPPAANICTAGKRCNQMQFVGVVSNHINDWPPTCTEHPHLAQAQSPEPQCPGQSSQTPLGRHRTPHQVAST